ncbi:MAG TPA: hypothetical protein VKS60_18985 [Stellaceae bacterium]|nr:hypothetical protein [Stellaceae bacterium]
MRPTSRELIERIAEALTDTVLPAVAHDKWAASTVRSATTLLNHLAERVEREVPVLLADNADAEETLRAVRALVAPQSPSPPFRGEREGPAKREGEVGLDAPNPPHLAPTLSPPMGRRGSAERAFAAALDETAPVPSHDAVALDARNGRYQEAIEALLHALYEPARSDDVARTCRTMLRDYLGRRRAREREMYFPAFLGPPF